MSAVMVNWRDLPISLLAIPVATRRYLTEKAHKIDGKPLVNYGDVWECLEACHDIGLGSMQEKARDQIAAERARQNDPAPAPAVVDGPSIPDEPAVGWSGSAEPVALAEPSEQENRDRECQIAALVEWKHQQYEHVTVVRQPRVMVISAVNVKVHLSADNDIEHRVWVLTPYQAAMWWQNANMQVARRGCSLEIAIDDNCPDVPVVG